MKVIKEMGWEEITNSLNQKGFARIPVFLSGAECELLKSLYDEKNIFRNVIRMERYRFGKGEYKYFSYPLPDMIHEIRTALYPELSRVANNWMDVLKVSKRFPDEHAELISICHSHHQVRPTPLILRYEAGGFNTLHQDLYGEVYFPFQVVFVLSQQGVDFSGGEFVMTEQVPRAQSIARVVDLQQGDGLIFTTNFRPARSSKGHYRAVMKHGISEVTSGVRYALGVIFHDAA